MTEESDAEFGKRLSERYSDFGDVPKGPPDLARLTAMAGRGSCRAFRDDPVPDPVLELLCAVALASPTKSDLQQRDIVLLTSPEARRRLAALVQGQAWVADAPMLIVFCGNNRRQSLLHDWHSVPFANDHLDAFFNAAADAAIALGAFVTAAETMGLGCCPISAVRNEAEAVSELLELPERVFPFAGLAIGYPKERPEVSKRLPLTVTCHRNVYREDDLQQTVRDYDRDRAKAQPYTSQRFTDTFGVSETYGWSEDKVRQYSRAERADFGAFVRAKGFKLT